MNKYQSIINTFDIYGYRPHLFIGNFHRNGTFLGLILTFLSLIFMITISSYFIFQLFDTKKVSVIYTIKGLNDKMIELEVSKNTFYFTIEIQDPFSYNAIMNERIFYPKAYYKKAIRNNKNNSTFNWTIKELEISNCNINDFNINYQHLFLNHPLNQTYCIKNLNEGIFGTFQKEKYSFIYVDLIECKNSSKKKDCLPKEEIDYYLNGTFIAIAFQEITIDPKNYKQPNQPIISEYYTTISHNYFKEIHMYFKEVEVITDEGYLFENRKSKKFTQFADVRDMISFKINSESFAEISIKVYHKSDMYSRNYIDLETVVADIGGFVKFISMIFYFIHYIFSQTGINQKIINKLFFIINEKYYRGFSFNNFNVNKNNSVKNYGRNARNNLTNNLRLNDSSNNNFIQNINLKGKKNRNFNLNENNNNNNIININTIKIKEFKTFSDQQICVSPESKFNIFNRELSPCRNRSFKIKSKKFKKLNVSYFDKLFLFCGLKHKRENIELYIKGLNMIKSKLDMIYIISESYKNDLIKSLILNENQIKILERMYKPELTQIDFNNELINIENTYDYLDKEALEAYISIKTNLFSFSDEERKNKTKLYDNFFIELVEKQYSL